MRLDADQLAAITKRQAQPRLRLLRAEDVYAHRSLLGSRVPIADWPYLLYPPLFVDRPAPDLSRRGQIDTGAVTYARVEAGRWIAECPFCPSAQVVTPLDPRFLCAGSDGCANAPVRGAYARVIFPPEQVRDQIESVLLARPDRNNRNWFTRERVGDLIAENLAHLEPGWEGR